MSADPGSQKAKIKTLVCFALKEEAAAFQKLTDSSITCLITGIGQRNAERALKKQLADYQPDKVLTCGFAGGLNPDLKIGDVVFTTDDPTLRTRLEAAGARSGAIHCATRVAVTTAEKQCLRQSTSADAVEMESGAIQALCREHGIPCATVRVISDTAHDDLPLDFNALSKADQNLDFGKLTFALMKQPQRIPALLRLQKNCRIAAQRLSEVLQKALAG